MNMLHGGLELSNVGSVHPGLFLERFKTVSCRGKGGFEQYRTGNLTDES
jgi:hypothetical protein